MSALIIKRHHRLPGGQLLHAGDEIPPGLLEAGAIDLLMDADILVEVPTRLSYFALLHSFAGSKSADEASSLSALFPELAIPRLDSTSKQA